MKIKAHELVKLLEEDSYKNEGEDLKSLQAKLKAMRYYMQNGTDLPGYKYSSKDWSPSDFDRIMFNIQVKIDKLKKLKKP